MAQPDDPGPAADLAAGLAASRDRPAAPDGVVGADDFAPLAEMVGADADTSYLAAMQRSDGARIAELAEKLKADPGGPDAKAWGEESARLAVSMERRRRLIDRLRAGDVVDLPPPVDADDAPLDDADGAEVVDMNAARKARAKWRDRLRMTMEAELAPRIDDGGAVWWYVDGVYQRTPTLWPVMAAVLEAEGVLPSADDLRQLAVWAGRKRPSIGHDSGRAVINLANGLVRVEDVAAGGPVLIPHDLSYAATVQHPVEFDPAAECPAALAFLAERAEQDVIDLLFEVLGQALYRGPGPKRLVQLIGPPDSGKTTAALMMTALLGRQHVTNVVPAGLGERFKAAELVHSCLNVVGDVGSLGGPGAVRQLMALLGGDWVQVERKGQHPFSAPFYGVWLTTGNDYMKTSVFTRALFERVRIVDFAVAVAAHLQRPREEVVAEMTTPAELSGLLNLALAGLARTLRSADYSTPVSAVRHGIAYRAKADHVHDHVTRSWAGGGHDGDWHARSDIRARFETWCAQEGIAKPAPVAALYDAVEALEGVTTAWRSRKHGDRTVRGYSGLRRLPDPGEVRAEPLALDGDEPF